MCQMSVPKQPAIPPFNEWSFRAILMKVIVTTLELMHPVGLLDRAIDYMHTQPDTGSIC